MSIKISEEDLCLPRSQQQSIFLAEHDGTFLCGKERCGRRFENETRVREHWARMHGRSSVTQTGVGKVSNKAEELKLPSIHGSTNSQSSNNGSSIMRPAISQPSLRQPGKLSQMEASETLHPAIKGAVHDLFHQNAAKQILRKPLLSTNPSFSRPSTSLSSVSNTTTSSSVRDSANKSSMMNFSNSSSSGDLLLLSTASSTSDRDSQKRFSAIKKTKEVSPLTKTSLRSVASNREESSSNKQVLIKISEEKSSKTNISCRSNIISSVEKKKEILFGKLAEDEEEVEDAIFNMSFEKDNEEEDETAKIEIEEQIVENAVKQINRIGVTAEMVLELTGCSDLSEVEQLIVRKKNVSELSDEFIDWSELSQMWYVGVTHNPRLNDISGLASVPDNLLVEVNLEYNCLSDISPLFRHTQLRKLYLSGNQITSITSLRALSQLSVLCVMKNKIRGFDETINTLECLGKLEELEMEQNPVSSRFNYKYDVIWRLKLKKLDGDKVTDFDKDLSKDFQRDYIQYCRQTNRPATAGSMKQVGKESSQEENSPSSSSYRERFKEKVGVSGGNNRQVVDSVRELESARALEDQLKQELLESELESKVLQARREELTNESRELASSLAEFHQLSSTKNSLTSKYRGYVATLTKSNEGDETASSQGLQFIKTIFKLNLRIADLESDNTKLQLDNEELQLDKDEMEEMEQFQQEMKRDQCKSQPLRPVKEGNMVQVYDASVDVDSDDDLAGYQGSGKVGSQEKDSDGDIEEEQQGQEEEEEEQLYNYANLNFDIGFDSDDLDEDTKEIKKLLEANERSLRQVKRDLNNI